MIRDGLAEEGFEVLVHFNPRTGWDVAISSDKNTEGAQERADAIAVELRRSYDLVPTFIEARRHSSVR
jgi:hypothetical protein